VNCAQAVTELMTIRTRNTHANNMTLRGIMSPPPRCDFETDLTEKYY
jgi:hypothetical protein